MKMKKVFPRMQKPPYETAREHILKTSSRTDFRTHTAQKRHEGRRTRRKNTSTSNGADKTPDTTRCPIAASATAFRADSGMRKTPAKDPQYLKFRGYKRPLQEKESSYAYCPLYYASQKQKKRPGYSGRLFTICALQAFS